MITRIPHVTIGGRKTAVYSVDFTNGGSAQPSELTLTFINKDGRLNLPETNTSSMYTIKIGTFFQFNGYVVETSDIEASDAHTFSIKYFDDSIILDKTFVGLNGIHGPGFGSEVITGSYKNSIFLGEQVDPCKDLDPTFADPCAPTGTGENVEEENLNRLIDCKEQALTKILDVVYSFSQLLGKIRSLGIIVNNEPKENLNYFARHTGSVREVLNAWCQEYGITYYWNNGINFVDLKLGIDINDEINGITCKIIDKKTVRSITGNYSQAGINYFGLDGQIKSYAADLFGGTRYQLFPITMSDIFRDQFGTGELNGFIKKYYGSLELLQKLCTLSRYSPKLRDIYLQKYIYQVTNRSYHGDNGTRGKKSMPLLGTEIILGYSPADVETDATFVTTHLNQYKPYVDGFFADYFAVKCYYNKEVHEKFIELEKYLANSFMGRYWIRRFNSKGFSFSAPGGSPEFIPSPSASTFEFSSRIPRVALKTNAFLAALFDISTTKNTTNMFNGGMILLDRKSPWQPEETDIQFIIDSDIIEKSHFNAINEVIPDVPRTSDWEEVYMFEQIGDKQPVVKFFAQVDDLNFNFVAAGTGDHPLEKDNVNVPVIIKDVRSHYGLRSAVCKAYRLTLNSNSIFIYLPVQSHDNYGNQMPGLDVLTERSGSASFKVLIKKLQRIIADYPNDSNRSVGLRVNFRDATQYLNKILKRIENTCQYDEEEVEKLLRAFSAKFSYSAQIVNEKIFYSVAGFPDDIITMEDGLDSFSIKLDGGSGVITEIQYSNIPKILPGDALLEKDFERRNIINYNKSFFSSDDKEVL